MVEQGATSDPWRLDPARFPQRLALELTEEAYAALAAISERTGRSISDIAADVLAQSPALDSPHCKERRYWEDGDT